MRSLGSPALPNSLPAQLATFIGRTRELAEVGALVASSRLVTLTGAGGCGKTRLGLQVAAGLLDGSGDGVWLVELAAVSGENAVAPAIRQALGIACQPGRPILETLLDVLAPQAMLIVLDNCEHLIGACAKTADAILRHCPRVHLVATSREPLGIGGEAIYRVPPLSLPQPGGGPTAPGLIWPRRHELCGRPGTTASAFRSTWAGCCARTTTRTARGPASRKPCASAAAPGIVAAWPTPVSVWPAWPPTTAIGTGRCAPRRRTGLPRPNRTTVGGA